MQSARDWRPHSAAVMTVSLHAATAGRYRQTDSQHLPPVGVTLPLQGGPGLAMGQPTGIEAHSAK